MVTIGTFPNLPAFPPIKGNIPFYRGQTNGAMSEEGSFSIQKGISNMIVSREELTRIVKFQVFIFRILSPYEKEIEYQSPEKREMLFQQACLMVDKIAKDNRLQYFVLPVTKESGQWKIDWKLIDNVIDASGWSRWDLDSDPSDLSFICPQLPGQPLLRVDRVLWDQNPQSSEYAKLMIERKYKFQISDFNQPLVQCSNLKSTDENASFPFFSEFLLVIPIPLSFVTELSLVPFAIQRIRRDFLSQGKLFGP
jgi:hypothetical protein